MSKQWAMILVAIGIMAGVALGSRITVAAYESAQQQERMAVIADELAMVRTLGALMRCESGFRPTVPGDGGDSYGILQFQKPTFAWMKTAAGMPDLNYRNPEDQMVLAWWALRNGHGRHWTCYEKAVAKAVNF